MVDLPSSQSHRHLLQSSSSPHLGHHQDVQVLKDYFWQKSFRIRIFSFNRGLLAVALILVAIKAEDPDLSTNESLSFIHFDPFSVFTHFDPLSKDAPTTQFFQKYCYVASLTLFCFQQLEMWGFHSWKKVPGAAVCIL